MKKIKPFGFLTQLQLPSLLCTFFIKQWLIKLWVFAMGTSVWKHWHFFIYPVFAISTFLSCGDVLWKHLCTHDYIFLRWPRSETTLIRLTEFHICVCLPSEQVLLTLRSKMLLIKSPALGEVHWLYRMLHYILSNSKTASREWRVISSSNGIRTLLSGVFISWLTNALFLIEM